MMEYTQFLERAGPYFSYLKTTARLSKVDMGILHKFAELLLAKPLLADRARFERNLEEYINFLYKGKMMSSEKSNTFDWLGYEYACVMLFESFPEIKRKK